MWKNIDLLFRYRYTEFYPTIRLNVDCFRYVIMPSLFLMVDFIFLHADAGNKKTYLRQSNKLIKWVPVYLTMLYLIWFRYLFLRPRYMYNVEIKLKLAAIDGCSDIRWWCWTLQFLCYCNFKYMYVVNLAGKSLCGPILGIFISFCH